MSDDLVERLERWMCNRQGEQACGCPSCVVLAEVIADAIERQEDKTT